MNIQKLESIIWHINRYQKIPDDALQDTLIALNLALLVSQEELPRAKDTPSEEFRLCGLADLRNKVGITQEALAQRMRENGREIKFQGDIMKLERGYNSPTVSRLKDYVEALGYTLNISATKDDGSYPLDVNALTRSRTKDARKK
jgi:hypothetical protein